MCLPRDVTSESASHGSRTQHTTQVFTWCPRLQVRSQSLSSASSNTASDMLGEVQAGDGGLLLLCAPPTAGCCSCGCCCCLGAWLLPACTQSASLSADAADSRPVVAGWVPALVGECTAPVGRATTPPHPLLKALLGIGSAAAAAGAVLPGPWLAAPPLPAAAVIAALLVSPTCGVSLLLAPAAALSGAAGVVLGGGPPLPLPLLPPPELVLALRACGMSTMTAGDTVPDMADGQLSTRGRSRTTKSPFLPATPPPASTLLVPAPAATTSPAACCCWVPVAAAPARRSRLLLPLLLRGEAPAR